MRIQIASLVAASVAFGGIGIAGAQTTPHQALQRTNIGTGLGQTELPSGGVFEPRVDAAIQYVANLELVANGQPQVDMAGLELAPGFYASYSTRSVTAAIDYSLISRSWEESDYDDVSHDLAANGQWFAVPEWFSILGRASYSDSIIDPRDGLNYGGLGIFGPGNLTEIATAGITPLLQHRFNVWEFSAEYNYGRVWYLDEGKGQPLVGFVDNQDSEDESARLSVGTADEASKLSARVFYDWERSEFDQALPYEYERAGLEAGYRIGRTWTVLGDVGRESDLDASTTEGGLDEDFWSAGFRWDPTDRTSVEARAGERFFGNSYLFLFGHRARLLEFDASYTEQPTVETRLLSLGEFQPGELPPGLPEAGLGRVNSTPFISKESRAAITAKGSRTSVSLTGYLYDRDYVRNLLGDETRTGVGLDVTRQLASNLSVDLSAYYTDFETSATTADPAVFDPETYYDTGVTVRLNRTSGLHFTLGAEAGYLTRAGDADYEGWWTALRVRWMP
jgi:hypothetical protein